MMIICLLHYQSYQTLRLWAGAIASLIAFSLVPNHNDDDDDNSG